MREMIRAEEVPMKRFLCWVLLALLPACAAAAYPEKPITMIIAYPPGGGTDVVGRASAPRSEEHTSELQSRLHLVCRLLLEKKTHTIFFQLLDKTLHARQ